MLELDVAPVSVDSKAGPRRPSRRARLNGQARAALLWGLAFSAVAHVIFVIGTQRHWPQLRDPEFGYKLMRLRQQIAEEPDRPVLMLLGSSRTGQGFRPGVLPGYQTPDGRTPFVFNFSQVGSGPLAELVTLRRLLDEGVRPKWLAIEILPPLLGRKLDACGNPKVGVSRLTWSDVSLLRRYAPEPDALASHWFKAQLAPWYAHRFSLMNHYAANWLPWRLRLDHWKALDGWGWSDLGVDTEVPVKNLAALELARQTYQEELKVFQIAPMQDRALRDLIALGRQENIPTVCYLMPEGRIFQSWYPPPTRACIDEYLTRISREYNLPIVDARNWIDDDYFQDSHHLDRRGATRFTRLFGDEVLPSLLAGKLDGIRPVLMPIRGTYPQEPRQQPSLLETQVRPSRPASSTLAINGGKSPAGSPGKSGESRSLP
jgi:hypothetical protein